MLQKYEETGKNQPYGKLIPLVELDTCPFGIDDNNQASVSPPLWVEREKNKWK